MPASSPTCPRCGAPRTGGPECPHCGVVYARAERRAGLQPLAPAMSAAAQLAHDNALLEARSELQLAKFAVPVALLTALALARTDMGGFFLRTFFGMWLHELGHAVAAWVCGFPAVPGPWFTSVGGERSFVFALTITGGLAWAIWRTWTDHRRVLSSLAMAVLVLQLGLTLVLSPAKAETLISFCGDAGSLVFGSALMATFFVPPGHKLHRDWLRWGFLVIGAASFADTFPDWWTARHEPSIIAFGEIEGRGDTDPTSLLQAGWTVDQMVARYVGIGVFSLIALAASQVVHFRRTREALERLEDPPLTP